MRYPKQIKARRNIEALTGIKSSLDKIRSVIALVYLLYVANGRKSSVRYSVAMGSKISIDSTLLKSIEDLIGRKGLEPIINSNPLLTNQYEPLYVGVTLLMKLGYLKMEGKQNTAERTGGIRFPKQLYFANNTLVLDLIIKGIPEDVRYTSLYEWLQNKEATNRDFEDRVCMFLSTCTIFTQFKLRDETNNELFFQTEGIYAALKEGSNDVIYNDSHEFVGPTRIYNNVLREGLEPWIKINKSILSFSEKNSPDAESVGDMISTTLDIHSVNNDALVEDDDTDDGDTDNIDENISKDYPLQRIFYGAPGTGKSNIIKREVDDQYKTNFRVTFHPDSDYSTFVGCYKPTMKENVISKNGVETKEEQIVYRFVPQAFTKAYTAAWNTKEDVYLIIEEINRGNCAQIFGDLFQLLDRKDGFSEYPVDADSDLAEHIRKELAGSQRTDFPEEVKEGKKLVLPSNLYIWATMNTSDQSLFPIDSAFKRRWDWKYMKICNHPDKNYKIKLADTEYDWWDFLQKINEIIASMTSSADKQLGYFFCKAKDGIIDEETFVSKVIFYLWNDVFKDYGFEDASLFQYKDDKGEPQDLTFPYFYDEEGMQVNTVRLKDFIENVMNWKKEKEESK